MRTALFWSVLQSILRLILSFVSIKVTAVYLGPTGLALVGQLGNFINLVQGCIGNAIQTGVVKLTAESSEDGEQQLRVWSTGFHIALMLGISISLVVMAASRPISVWLFDSVEYWPVIVLSGPCIVLGIVGSIFTGILNGLKRIRELALVTIFMTILGAAAFIPLAYQFGVWGGLVGTAISGTAVFFAGWAMVARTSVLSSEALRGGWDSSVAREVFHLYPMLLAHTLFAPLALILVRNILASGLDMQAAGYWQATWRISDMYTGVLITALSFYLMPHLSSIKDDAHFFRELLGTVYKVILLTAAAALAIYILRDAVVTIVFTEEFGAVKDLLLWQLVGDVFKMASWPLRMALMIKLRTRWYISLEVLTPMLQAGSTFLLLPYFQVNAATLGYALAYLITVVVLVVAFRDDLLRLFLGLTK